jgi:hypothetical protein
MRYRAPTVNDTTDLDAASEAAPRCHALELNVTRYLDRFLAVFTRPVAELKA